MPTTLRLTWREALNIAASRGWDESAWRLALASKDEDAIGLLHPFNELTEDEVESTGPNTEDWVDHGGEA